MSPEWRMWFAAALAGTATKNGPQQQRVHEALILADAADAAYQNRLAKEQEAEVPDAVSGS